MASASAATGGTAAANALVIEIGGMVYDCRIRGRSNNGKVEIDERERFKVILGGFANMFPHTPVEIVAAMEIMRRLGKHACDRKYDVLEALKNMNVIFGLKVQVSVGERVIAGIATGTGACLTALPLPSSPLPKLVSGRKDQFVSEPNGKDSDTSEDERDGVDLPAKRGACIVQLDDAEDAVSLLREPHMPEGFAMCNTELMPGLDGFSCNLQLFMQTYRAKLFPGIHPSRILSQHFDHIIQSLFVKLRKLVPCCLASLSFHIELPDQDELQVAVLGTAVGLEDGVVDVRAATRTASAVDADAELIFPMDEERVADSTNAQSQKQHRMHRLSNLRYQELCRERHGVDLTSLDHVPGGKTEKYLGNLDFFFIRESTGIREEGGLNGFVQGFMTEILAIVRAHVSSLGGNAVVAFRMTQCVLLHNPHKNQGQCLINVAGDAVLIHYQSQPPDSEHLETSSSSC